jgi:lysophospholipase L1-like esterase
MDSAFVSIQRTFYRSMTFYWAQREFLQARGLLFGKRRIAGRRRGRGPNPVPRVSPSDYERNLSTFIRLARQRGVLPIVLVIPPNPFYDWSDWATGRSAQVRREKEDFAEAARCRDRGDIEAARRLFMSLVPATVFETLNEVSRRVTETQGVPLVDVSRAFYEELDREQLYIDDVHPNREGTDVIARALADVILERTAPGAAPPPQR